MAAGRANRERAAALFIRGRNATAHAGHIRARISVGLRAEAAAWAVRLSLA